MTADAATARLRWLVGVATVVAITGLGLTGVLCVGVVVVEIALIAGLAAVSTRRTAASDVVSQVVVLAAVVAVALLSARHATAVPGAAVRAGAAPVAAALAATQPLLWRGVREIAGGAVLAAGLVVVCCAATPSPLDAVVVVPEWALLLVVVRELREARLRAGRRVATVSSGRRPATGAGAVALAMVAGVAVFLVVPVPDHPRFAGAALDAVGAGSRAPGGFTGDRMSLLARGGLSSDPVLAVPGDSPPLWRAQVFGTYDGAGWTSADAIDARLPWLGTPTQAWTRFTSPYVRAGTGDAEAAVVRLDPTDPTVYAPGDVVAVRAPVAAVVSGPVGDVRLAGGGPPPPAYVVRWRPQAAGGDSVTPAGPAAGDAADPQWRQLPAELPDRVRSLARAITAGAPTRAAAVTAIERWLRAHAVYTLDAPLPAPGADAVDDFLFRTRAGFCEHFASAETVLLRAIGVPARVATGLAYGTRLPDGRRSYAWKDAHAWVEVYYPSAGWVVSDPTAGVPLAATAGGTSALSRSLWTLGRWLTGVPGGRPALAAAVVAVAALLTAGSAALRRRGRLVAGALLRLVRRQRRSRRARRAPASSSPAELAYARLEQRLLTQGAQRQPYETLRDLSVRLGGAACHGGAVADAFAALEAEWYGGRPYDAERSVAAAATLDALCRDPVVAG